MKLKKDFRPSIAFIDGQNLHLGTNESGWAVDHKKLRIYLREKYQIIVSGDGDYKRLVDFLIKKDHFGKMLFPNTKFASSLYKSLGTEFFDNLEAPDVKKKIVYTQGRK